MMFGGIDSNVFAAAADAARVAADLEISRDENTMADDESREDEGAAKKVAEARLAAALDVNRTLHATLRERRRLLQESAADIEVLEARLAGRAVEEPERKARLDALQMPAEPSKARIRDANLLRREIAKLEAQIVALNANNLSLADLHRNERNGFVESQNKLRILGKRERELAKHVHAIASKLTETSMALSQNGGHEFTDFRKLPGMFVGKIAGEPRRSPPVPIAASATASHDEPGVQTLLEQHEA